jgi:RimJ/RimL family protein N-acetyltransferase
VVGQKETLDRIAQIVDNHFRISSGHLLAMLIRRLTVSDVPSFRALRLAALDESPASFASSYQEEATLDAEHFARQLGPREDRGVFGSFDGSRLVGIAGLGRENLRQLGHKAFLWGVYVEPDMRRRGVSKMLISEILSFAKRVPGIIAVNLTVNAANTAAVSLYASLGFQQFGLEPKSLLISDAFHDEMHMRLQLARSDQ